MKTNDIIFSTNAGGPGIKALHVLFKEMQSACANYLEPTTYIRRFPSELTKFATEFEEPHPLHSDTQKRVMVERRNEAFLNDIIWMLDGPEQRAAEAALVHPTPTSISAPVEVGVEMTHRDSEMWVNVASFHFLYQAEAFIGFMNIQDPEYRYRLVNE